MIRLLCLTASLAGASFTVVSGGTPRSTPSRSSVREAGAAFASSDPTLQQTVWFGGTEVWSDPAAWSNGIPNSNLALAYIDDDNSVNSVVTVDSSFTVGDLTVNAGDALVIGDQQSLTVDASGFTGGGVITNDGTITVGPSGPLPYECYLNFDGNVTLDGAGTVTFRSGGSTRNGGTLTIGSSQTINGANINTFLGENATAFVNNGTIDANSSSGDALRFQPGPGGLTNNATMQASGGGVLELDGAGGGSGTGPYVNNSTITALTGSVVQLAGNPTLSGGTLATVGSGTINDVSGAILSDLTIAGKFVVTSGQPLYVQGTITNNATMTFGTGGSGNAELQLQGDVTLAGTGTVTFLDGDIGGLANLTIGSGVTLNGDTITNNLGMGQTNFVNHGTIDANSPGNGITIFPNSSGLNNDGTLEASGGSTLTLQGPGGGAGSGPFTNTNNGTITALTGSVVQLAGNPTLSGGTLATVGSGTINDVSGAVLSDLTIAGKFVVTSGQPLYVQGTITNNATMTFGTGGSGNAELQLQGDVTLAGTGTVTFLDGDIGGLANLTIGSGVTLNGDTITNNLGMGQTNFVNHGTIDANSPGNGITIFPNSSGLNNDGTLEASGGGTLALQGPGGGAGSGPFTNSGTMVAMPGSTVALTARAGVTNLDNNTLTGGTYKAIADTSGSMATLDFGGATFAVNAATIVLSGPNSVFAAVAPLSDNQGSFSLLALRQFTTSGALTHEGGIVLDAGATLHVSGAYTASGSKAALDVGIGGTASQGAMSPGILQVNGAATLAGKLNLYFSTGAALPPASATLTIVSATSAIGGSFSNVASGARLTTTDGRGSFLVSYGPGSATPSAVVLSAFVSDGGPSITSAPKATATVGQAFSYTITATESPTSFGVQGLPSGFTVNTTTGVISATPKAAGTITLTLNAYNSKGKGSETLTLTVANGTPVITSAATATATQGKAFSYQITASNSPTSFGVQGLPAGLTVNTKTGLISGTVSGAGKVTLTLNAYNASGKGSATLTLTVSAAPPVITSATTATATAGKAFSYQITASNQPTSFGVQGLPSGFTVNTTTGVISATPKAAGKINLTLNAYNAAGKGSATLTLTITQ